MLPTYLARFALLSYVFAMLATYLARFTLLVSSVQLYICSVRVFIQLRLLCFVALFSYVFALLAT